MQECIIWMSIEAFFYFLLIILIFLPLFFFLLIILILISLSFSFCWSSSALRLLSVYFEMLRCFEISHAITIAIFSLSLLWVWHIVQCNIHYTFGVSVMSYLLMPLSWFYILLNVMQLLQIFVEFQSSRWHSNIFTDTLVLMLLPFGSQGNIWCAVIAQKQDTLMMSHVSLNGSYIFSYKSAYSDFWRHIFVPCTSDIPVYTFHW